jgi:hypothetical protein
MSLRGISIVIGQALQGGLKYAVSVGASQDPNTTAPDYSAVASALAVLVADGASPTQGHVNTLNTNWTALRADADAFATKAASINADVILYFNAATVTKQNQALAAIRAIEREFIGLVRDN